MSVFDRLNRVIQSNLNSLVDKTEDPEKLIGQTIVDMDTELKQARRELVSTVASSKVLDKEALEHDAELAKWEERAMLALRSEDEDLAREALKQKARFAKKATESRRRASEQATAALAMKDMIERIEQKSEDLKARKSSLASQIRSARKAPGVDAASFGSAPIGGAFSELERMEGQVDAFDAEVEAHAVLDDPKRADIEAQFRALESAGKDMAIEDELAALKQKLSK